MLPDPTGKSVIILTGEFAGEEGICLGRAGDGTSWSVSPRTSDRVLELEFDRDFGIVVNQGQDAGRN
jgi:hypothetical protein